MITADRNRYTLTAELDGKENNIAIFMMRNGIPMKFEDMNDLELKTYAAISAYSYNKIVEKLKERGL